ncbi:MAG TPA: xanthine dehydrogenase family protein molybdopterin-binding subunit [Ktedonobacteraceae bacterium]|nr:xanthine dehydrogenase family protein molybdopterin-binding subunit [Ktedonobacteraceae bacterium]
MLETSLPPELQRRREDIPLITGQGHYVDDLRPPEGRPAILHMAVVRSPYAHATIKHMQLDAARAVPGVVAVFSGAELVRNMPTLFSIPMPGLKKPERRPMAMDRVRYVGDPVAVLVAESLYAAEDARDLVEIDYEPLPAVTDPEAALAPDAPLLYDDFGSNMAVLAPAGGGDIEAAFKNADGVVRLRVVNQRVAPSTMEPRACMFDYDPASGQLTAWLSSQAIYTARDTLANFLGIDRGRIHAYNADVGGGFGTKSGFVGEEIVAASLAVRLGRPVKWIETRNENLQAQSHGRGQINYIEAAYKNDGQLLGIRIRTIADLGAFLLGVTVMVPNGTPYMLSGPYRVQAVDSQVAGVFTNKIPTAPYRGAGRPEAAYVLERTMDRIAQELHLDPVDVRRRNFIPPDAFPYKTVTGLEYDSGNYVLALNKALELADYAGWRAKQQEQRKTNSARLLGIGLCTFVENSGGAMSRPGMPQEAATVRIRRDGTILVLSGVATNGQGHFTAFAQIASQTFNLPASKIEVRMNDTALPAFGIGTFGSRTLQTSGSAVLLAAEAVRDKAFSVAARQLEADPADLMMENGRVVVRGVPSRAIELGELARLVEEQPDLIENEAPNPANGVPIEGLAAWREFSPPNSTFSSGTHLAVVEVDTDTGEVHFRKFVAVDDCGRVFNPYLVDAQVHGALAQGIGQALYEEVLYDTNGQLLTGTLMDYTMPNSEQIPEFVTVTVETPSFRNPLGAKGVGEGGTIGAPPAVVNAVLDALAPLGIKTIDMPLKPEKIWSLIQAARNGTLQQEVPEPPPVFKAGTEKPKGDVPDFA